MVKRPGFYVGLRVHISARTLTGELLTLCVQFSLSLYQLEAILPYSPNLRWQRLKDATLLTHQQKRKKPKWGIGEESPLKSQNSRGRPIRISQGLWRNGANRRGRLTHVVKEMVESCGLPSSSWGSRETRGQPSASLKA